VVSTVEAAVNPAAKGYGTYGRKATYLFRPVRVFSGRTRRHRTPSAATPFALHCRDTCPSRTLPHDNPVRGQMHAYDVTEEFRAPRGTGSLPPSRVCARTSSADRPVRPRELHRETSAPQLAGGHRAGAAGRQFWQPCGSFAGSRVPRQRKTPATPGGGGGGRNVDIRINHRAAERRWPRSPGPPLRHRDEHKPYPRDGTAPRPASCGFACRQRSRDQRRVRAKARSSSTRTMCRSSVWNRDGRIS
jgi:hypothetical protein